MNELREMHDRLRLRGRELITDEDLRRIRDAESCIHQFLIVTSDDVITATDTHEMVRTARRLVGR